LHQKKKIVEFVTELVVARVWTLVATLDGRRQPSVASGQWSMLLSLLAAKPSPNE